MKSIGVMRAGVFLFLILGIWAVQARAVGELDPDVFVPSFYRALYPSLGLTSDSAAQTHWMQIGISQGLRGSSNFSSTEYLSSHPSLRTPWEAISDWTQRGRRMAEAGRSERAWIDVVSENTADVDSPAVIASGDRVETAQLPDFRTLKIVVKAPVNPTGPVLTPAPPAAGANIYLWLKGIADQARSQKASEVRLPVGIYKVQIPAGTLGAHWDLTGLRDVVIDGQGSTLIFTQAGRVGISMYNNQRVLMKNFSLDWSLKIASAGVVENDAATGQRVLRFTPGFSVDAETSVIRAVSLYSISAKRFVRSPTAEVYFGVNDRPIYDSQAKVFRSPLFQSFYAGQQLLARHYLYDGHTIYVTGKSTSDISFEKISIVSGPSMGFVFFQAGRGFRVSNCKVMTDLAQATRLISTAADALHVSSIEGDLIAENNEFAFMGDDALNIESKTAKVSSISTDSSGLSVVSFPLNNVRVSLGETLSFFHDGMGSLGSAVVSSLSVVSNLATVTLSQAVPGISVGVLVKNPKYRSSRYLVQNNVFRDHRARGMLIQSPNGVVRSNTLSNSTLNAINLTSDGRSWFEGSGAQNVVLSGNSIQSPGWAPTTPQIGAISIYSEASSGLAVSPQHGSILIQGNTIASVNGPAIFISSAREVQVIGNSIQSSNRVWLGTKYGVNAQGSLAVTRSHFVQFSANTRTGTSSGAQTVDSSTSGSITLQASY